MAASERSRESILVEDAVERLIDEKAQQKVSERHLKDLRLRLGRLIEAFRGRTLSEIGGEELNAWLRGLGGSPRTQAGYRRHVSILWRFGAVRGWCDEAPLRILSTPRPADGAVDVFTPEEAKRLLEAAVAETLPFVCLSLFAGLRSSEIERLTWEEVHRATKVIEVRTLKGRRSVQARYVPVSPTLERWLDLCGKAAGPVIPRPHSPDYIRHRLAEVRKAAGLGGRSNAARHTYISARLAIEPDVARVAAEAGNSPTVIQSSYRRPMLRSTAEAFFALLPEADSAEVIPIRAEG